MFLSRENSSVSTTGHYEIDSPLCAIKECSVCGCSLEGKPAYSRLGDEGIKCKKCYFNGDRI